MDEVGRGTTVKDGLAIAFAALHHLITVNKSRCLFATHFQELAEMLGNTNNLQGSGIFDNVRFYCSDVDEVGVSIYHPSILNRSHFDNRMITSPIHIACAQVLIATATD